VAVDYLVVSWVVADQVVEEAFLEISSGVFLTLSALEKCSESPDKRSPRWEQEARLRDLNSRLAYSLTAVPRGQA
jgi:hypothetical protein